MAKSAASTEFHNQSAFSFYTVTVCEMMHAADKVHARDLPHFSSSIIITITMGNSVFFSAPSPVESFHETCQECIGTYLCLHDNLNNLDMHELLYDS